MLLEILFGSDALLPGSELDLRFLVLNLTLAADEGLLLGGVPACTELFDVDAPEGVVLFALKFARSAKLASFERLKFEADSGEGDVGWE